MAACARGRGRAHLLLHLHLRLLALVLLANLLLLRLHQLQLLNVELLQVGRTGVSVGASAFALRRARASSAATAISLAFSSASCLMNCTICGSGSVAGASGRAPGCSERPGFAARSARLRDLPGHLRVVHGCRLAAQAAGDGAGGVARAGRARRRTARSARWRARCGPWPERRFEPEQLEAGGWCGGRVLRQRIGGFCGVFVGRCGARQR